MSNKINSTIVLCEGENCPPGFFFKVQFNEILELPIRVNFVFLPPDTIDYAFIISETNTQAFAVQKDGSGISLISQSNYPALVAIQGVYNIEFALLYSINLNQNVPMIPERPVFRDMNNNDLPFFQGLIASFGQLEQINIQSLSNIVPFSNINVASTSITSSSQRPEFSTPLNSGIYIGILIGIILLIVAVCLVTWLFLKDKQTSMTKTKQESTTKMEKEKKRDEKENSNSIKKEEQIVF